MKNPLADRLPRLAAALPHLPLAALPTPLSTHRVRVAGTDRPVLVKHDELSGPLFGGNKVRKLEYLLQHARERAVGRIATYGAAGSNHALATALYARQAGFDCTCLLSQQPPSPGIDRKLYLHLACGTELVRFGGARAERVDLQRRHLQGRDLALLPMGGSNWRGTLGFVNAALELAAQCTADVEPPAEVFVAAGTLGTAAGLALGFALAGLAVDVHAIRVADERFANGAALARLLGKTAALMRRRDPAVPPDLAERARVLLRHDFYGAGYGRSDAATGSAIAFAREAFGIRLDPTYAGKAMAALRHDLAAGTLRRPLFWNTCNAVPLPPVPSGARLDGLPRDFARHFQVAGERGDQG